MDITEFQHFFGDCELIGDKILVKNDLHDTIKFIKEKYAYDMLKDILAVDRRDKGIELTYHLYTTLDEEDLLLTTYVKDEAESIIDLYKSAIADENEIYDMFGITFIGNENLKRLYMPESWEGYPLRKDYIQDDTRLAWNDDNKA